MSGINRLRSGGKFYAVAVRSITRVGREWYGWWTAGFRCRACSILAPGDANRASRVERPFFFIEHNFLARRVFASWEDLSQQARQWCDRVNSTYKKHIRAIPRELFAVERAHLKPLPAWIPEVYRLQQRVADIEGYVSVNAIRY